MTPAGDTAVTDPSPSMGDAMDSFFAESSAPPAPDGGAPPDPGADPDGGVPPAPEGTADEPILDAQADAAAPPAPGAPNPNTPELPEGATLDGKQIRIDVPRFNNIYRDYKFAQEVRNIVPDVKTAQEYYQRASDLRHMHADFKSNDPNSIDQFLSYWENEAPEAYATMTARALERAPEAVRTQLTQQALTSHLDSLYAKAAETGDPQDLYRAQMVDFYSNGSYRKDPGPKPDPLAARERQLAERETRLKNEETQRAENQWKTWTQQTYGSINEKVDARINTALAPVKERFANEPDLFNALRDSIRSQTIKGVESDQEWLRNFNLDFKSARQTMSPGDRQALVSQYLARVDRILAGKAAPLIKQATQRLVTDSQQQHDRLAAGSARRGAAAPGTPVRTSVSTGQRDRSGMTLDEKIDADMALS